MFDSVAASQPFIQSGKLRPLAVATSKRVPIYRDLPTIAEAGLPGYAFTSWYGVFTTGGTDPVIVEKLAQEVRKIIARPDVRAQLDAQGLTPESSDPKTFKEQIDRELTRWTRDIKALGISAD